MVYLENWLLVANEPVQFDNNQLKITEFRKTTDWFGGLCRIYLKLLEKKLKYHNM